MCLHLPRWLKKRRKKSPNAGLTHYHPSAILIYSNSCCLPLEDVVPTKREDEHEERN